MSILSQATFWFVVLDVLQVFVPVAAAGVILFLSMRGRLKKTLPILNAILTVLLVLAITGTLSRAIVMHRIRNDVDQLLQSHADLPKIRDNVEELLRYSAPVDIIVDQRNLWERARDLLRTSGEAGVIYDTTSFRNNAAYEAEIERQRKLGSKIVRFICTESARSLDDFIQLPEQLAGRRDGSFELRHLPHALPFDCIIVQSGGSTSAIIGFKTSEEPMMEYSSALRIGSERLARDLLSMHQGFYANAAKQHKKSARSSGCAICMEIEDLKRGNP